MKPSITFTQRPGDPANQVVITFDPPVSSWSFGVRTLEELWQELTQATAHLLFGHETETFDAEMQDKLRTRILTVLLYWVSQKWLTIP